MVVTTESFLPNMGGLERNTFTLATALAKLGHEVTVLTATLETTGPEETAFPFKVVRGMGLGNCFSAIGGGDLIFVNAGISLKACLVAFFLGKKYIPIYAHHGLFVVDDPGFLGKIRRWLRKSLAQKAAASILLSRFSKDQLERLLPAGRALILPNPIDGELEKAAAGLPAGQAEKVFDLFFAGRLVRGKGIFVLVDALKMLRPGLCLKVAIAGEGPEGDEFFLPG